MFNKVLIPISSEYYGKQVLTQGEFLAKKFNSKIDLIYIIEEKTLNQTDKISDTYRTPFEKEETKKEIIRKQKLAADNIVFKDAEFIFNNIPFKKKTVEGEFTSIVKSELKKNKYDLIMMSFEKGCLLNYRLFDDIDIPVWIVAKTERQSILAVCSNLAPNKKVPDISLKLSETLDWKLHMIYIVDTEDSVQVDENGTRSGKKPENVLLLSGQEFTNEMKKKKIKVDMIKGSLEKETIKAAEKIKPNIVIFGREQKKKGPLGIPIKNLKKKLAEKCEYSILFVN